jgi:hypothetical protein
LLGTDEHVANTLEYKQLRPQQLPADWFTVSEIQVGQPDARYLVVMGTSWMSGANINPFWVFRHSAKSCELLLSVGAHELDVLKSATNGLLDIQIAALTADRYFLTRYKFDGRSYQVERRTSQPIGEEIPRDLASFETRNPLVQQVEQNPAPILEEARAWLWRQWWLEKPSYLKVTLHSKEGDETTTIYFVRKTGHGLDVLVQIHRILVDRAPHSGSRRPIVEDEIIIAVNVERRLALKNRPDRKTEVPEGQDVSPDSYELYFNNESGNNLVIL